MAKGNFIVFEGIDGSGKTTQAKSLVRYLAKVKIPHVFISFPVYQSGWGKMIRCYLDGDFGNVDEVSPRLASMLYAGDRLVVKDKIRKWLNAGKNVVCDRYIGSNLAHMGGKLKSQIAKLKFIKWLEDFEYGENKIPKEDLVILLSMPVNFSQKLMKARKLDIHERDVVYLNRVAEIFEYLAKKNKNWIKVTSVENGRLLSPQKIHAKVLDIITNEVSPRI